MQIIIKTKDNVDASIELDQAREEELKIQIQQLELQVKQGFGQGGDRKELYMILNHILNYPSTELSQIHRKSNRLGQLDVDKQQRFLRISDQNLQSQQTMTHICRCCGFILQDKSLSTCSHSLNDIHNLGISTYLYFKTITNVSVLLLIMLLIYSTYSFATNIKAASMTIQGNTSSQLLSFLSISLGSKQLYSSEQKIQMYVIGAWIGFAMLMLWIVAFIGLRYHQKAKQVEILMQAKSVSQFSLVIQNIPTGVTRAQLQRQLKLYLRELRQKDESINLSDIQVIKYNEGRPFYYNEQQFNDQQLSDVLKMKKIYEKLFEKWIKQRRQRSSFRKDYNFRRRKYTEYNRILQRKKAIVDKITKKIKQRFIESNQQNLTTGFVTFATNYQKNLVLQNNSYSLLSRIKDLIPCLKNQKQFKLKRGQNVYQIRILPAPDPQDIIWSNIGVQRGQICGRKLLTYSITIFILAISFVITYSLASAQVRNQKDRLLSIIISISISVINLIIGLVIEVLTGYQRDYTVTNYQISLSLKSIIAQLINSIFIPIIANYFIKQNIYGENGLIQDVFILGITNSLVYPLAKLLNPSYYLFYWYAKYYKLKPVNKLQMHQYQINHLYQKKQFQVGYQYIYIVNLFVFTCFFVSLQPIIPLFALLGLFLIFWIQKYNLYHRSQRPVPGTPLINTTISQLIYFGAIAYTLGSMTWANFLPTSQFKAALLPNIVALSIAVIIFLLPYQSIFRKLFSQKRMPEIFYRDNRIFFTSEYDRLNPSTSEKGVEDYYNFLKKKVDQLNKMDLTYQSRLSYQLQYANRPNFHQDPSQLFKSTSRYQGKNLIRNIVKNQSKNSMTPQMIANILRKDKNNSRINSQMKSHIRLSKIKMQPQKNLFRQYFQNNNELQMQVSQQQPSKQYLQDLKKVDSVLFDTKQKPNKKEYQQSCQLPSYLKDIQNAKSFMFQPSSKINNQSPTISIKKTEEQVEVKKTTIAKQKAIPKVNQNSNKSHFRKYMQEKQMFKQIDRHPEIPNRFSLNSQNILPLCIEETGQGTESEVCVYDIAAFQ